MNNISGQEKCIETQVVAGRIRLYRYEWCKAAEMVSGVQSSAMCSGKAALLPSPQWAGMQK